MAYQVNINNQEAGNIEIDNLADASITWLSKDTLNIRHGDRNYQVKCVAAHQAEKIYKLIIEGVEYEVELLDEVDQMVHSLGMEVEDATATGDIEAPMPGKVLEFKVAVGDEVSEGDPLVILEAMKMENILKAAGPGVVESLHAEVGETVDKGALLISMS